MRYLADLNLPTNDRTHGRHDARATVGDGLHNVLGATLTEPAGIAVGEIGVGQAAAAVRAVALRTVVHKLPLADGQRTRIAGKRLNRLRGKLRIQRRHLGANARDILLVLAHGRPFQQPLEAAQTREDRQVSQCENDGNDEQPHPPSRQRIVQFTQVLIPDMTGRVVVDLPGFNADFGTSCHPEQEGASRDRDQTDDCHVERPKSICEITHCDCSYSDRNGSCAASSNCTFREGRQAHTRIPTNAAKAATVTMLRSTLISILMTSYLNARPKPCKYATSASSSVLPLSSAGALAISASVYGTPTIRKAFMWR